MVMVGGDDGEKGKGKGKRKETYKACASPPGKSHRADPTSGSKSESPQKMFAVSQVLLALHSC